jgi:HD-GYP domain-containing protein (c-di-GMP phosphodiesterase class II)
MMRDSSKTNQELIAEISALNKRIRELEQTSSEKIREESERRARQLTELYETSVELTAELNLDVLLHSIVERALKLIGGAACNCYLVNPQTDLLERVVSAGTGLVPSPKTRQRGEGMVGQVWVKGTPLLVNDYASWPGRTRAYDSFPSRALVAAPFRWGTEILGVLNIMALLPHQYTQMDVEMLSLFAMQAAIAIRNARLHDRMKMELAERKKAEKKLQRTLDSLRKAINITIQVMVSAVETRDPYTAGHQVRSADLSRAIATEIGLSQDKIDGIRMVGSIHDIGKLSIPAEILSKPTKLSEIEFSLIKEHACKGFEMLKDVESPWPLAEIVYQHHERMDGSGYPRNLKGEEICIEARILAVADVVEAMASHRPYRPGLGIDAALNEIEKNRGILYDNDVADACLKLFREKDFKLEGA